VINRGCVAVLCLSIASVSGVQAASGVYQEELIATVDTMLGAMIEARFDSADNGPADELIDNDLGGDIANSPKQQTESQPVQATPRNWAQKPVRQQQIAKIDTDAKKVVTPQSGCFAIRTMTVTDSVILDTNTVSTLIGDLIGECATKDVIGDALKRINGYLLDNGYVTSRVYIGPQDLADGSIELSAVDGRVESFSYRDNSFRDRSKVLAAFPTREGQILNIKDLERGVDQMSRVRSSKISMNLVPGAAAGTTMVELKDAEGINLARSIRFKGGFDNSGSQATGTEKLTLGIDGDNLLGLNDTWTMTHIGSIDTNALAVTGSVPTGYWTHSVNYSYSDYLNPIDSDTQMFGRSETLGAESTFRFFQTKSDNLDLKLGVTKKFSDRVINDVELSDQRLSVGRVGVAYSLNQGFSLGLNLGYANGLTLWDALDDRDADPSAPKAQFSKYEFSGNFSRPLNESVSLSSNWSGQYSEDYLYSSEQISAGGQGSVRGFTKAPAAGDSGMYAKSDLLFRITQDLGSDWLNKYAAYLQPYVGIDAAWVKDNASTKEVTLVGLGAGVKLNAGSLSGEFGVGVPVSRSSGTYSKEPDRYVKVVYDLYDY